MPFLHLALLLACGSPSHSADPAEAHMTRAPNVRAAPGAEPVDADTAARIAAAWSDRPTDYAPRTRHLEPDGGPTFTNRLFLETSPYLRQHAHNPVDWFPWGDEAFALARRLGRPVLLSVGYSTCHWCHVMEEESFEDLEIARYLNSNYVLVKVDREERPDVDAVYMAAVQALTGRGGWPMTVWLTPDREPFYAGTYFPPRDGDRGARTGFLTLLEQLKSAYDTQPERVATGAAELAEHIRKNLAPELSGALPTTDTLATAAERYRARYDAVSGGMVGAPKFPSSFPVRFLLREHRRTKDAELLSMATHTLHAMARGGMYDQIGGGFHRYSTDRAWLVPHFEKMLYDNALLALTYLEGWQHTGDEAFARTVHEILRSVERDMTSGEGAFTSATDADSLVPHTGEREEGWFFTWTPEEISAVLDPESARAVLAWYAIEPGGNFEGRSIPHTPRVASVVAGELGLTEERLFALVQEAREVLYAERGKRPPPLRDDKILTAWNGLMISAYARAGLVLGAPEYIAAAERAADFVLTRLRHDGRLRRTYLAGEARHAAVLEDYAFLAAGLVDLFEATGEPRWLREAMALDAVVLAHFEDTEAGGWFRTADDAEVLLAREKPDYDGAEPTGASVHARTLLRLAALTSDDAYRVRADKALGAYGERIAQGALAEMLHAVDWSRDEAKEVVIVAPTDRDEAAPLLAVLARHGPRNHVLAVATEAGVSALAEVAPIAGGKVARDGAATAYVCEQGLCQAPVTDPEALRAQLEGL